MGGICENSKNPTIYFRNIIQFYIVNLSVYYHNKRILFIYNRFYEILRPKRLFFFCKNSGLTLNKTIYYN